MDAKPVNLFGRDTAATVQHWDAIVKSIGVAPSLFMGPLPAQSPNNRKFRHPRYRGQLIGSCVGENTAAMVETLLRMPAGRTVDSEPIEGKELSPLWVYWLARRYSRSKGINLGGEGAICSHAIEAIHDDGVLPYEEWPATDEAYRKYSDRIKPDPDDVAHAEEHPVEQMAILDSWGKIMEYLAGGFTVSIGVPIPSGIQRTGPDGEFRWSGRTIGGHCMELLDFDTAADRAYLGNSWANVHWGARSDEPQWQGRCEGFTNIGWCSLTDLERVFSGRNMQNGTSEAVVANNVVGWAPKVDYTQW